MGARKKDFDIPSRQGMITEVKESTTCRDSALCLAERRRMFDCPPEEVWPWDNLGGDCRNCRLGIEREGEAAATRPPLCGRCDAPLKNPEASFCSLRKRGARRSCLAHEVLERPRNFIEYFDVPDGAGTRSAKEDRCQRGHLFVKGNTGMDGEYRRCLVCKQIKIIIKDNVRIGTLRGVE